MSNYLLVIDVQKYIKKSPQTRVLFMAQIFSKATI